MAIAPTLPGVEITVEVDNAPLQEHQYEDEDSISNDEEDINDSAITKYLSEPFDATTPVHADIYIDNNYIQAPLRETGDIVDSRGYKYAMAMSNEEGQTVTQKFLFSELDIDDEPHSIEGMRQRLSGIGTIQVYLYLVISESRTEAPSVPRLDLSQLDPMNEKVSQKCALVRGDVLTHQATLTEPQVMRSSEFHQAEVGKVPIATYTFHYRSTRALKSLGVIPRTPSPSRSPTVEAEGSVTQLDLASMTTEQLIAELIQRREREEKTVRIKREHADAFDPDDDEDEIEWTGTRPVRTRVFGGVID